MMISTDTTNTHAELCSAISLYAREATDASGRCSFRLSFDAHRAAFRHGSLFHAQQHLVLRLYHPQNGGLYIPIETAPLGSYLYQKTSVRQ